MHVIVDPKDCKKGLAAIKGAVPRKMTLPICLNVHMEAINGQLKLTATDLELRLSAVVPATVQEEGAITTAYKELVGIITTMAAKTDLELFTNDAGLRIINKGEKREYTLPTRPAADYPPTRTIPPEGATTVLLMAPAFKEALHITTVAAATVYDRPVLQGLQVTLKEEVQLWGADGFQAVSYHLPALVHEGDEVAVIIPAGSLSKVGKLLGDGSVGLTVSPKKAIAVLEFGIGQVATTQLLSGTYPDIASIIPDTSPTYTVLETRALQRAVEGALPVVKAQEKEIVHLVVADDALTITAEDEEKGTYQEEIPAQIVGDSTKIAFNCKFLLNMLGRMRETYICMGTSGPSGIAIFWPLGEKVASTSVAATRAVSDYMVAIMPVFVERGGGRL